MEYIALYIRPYKRCQYKKNFNCFWCAFLIWQHLQTCPFLPLGSLFIGRRSSLSSSDKRSAFRGSLDIRLKAEYDVRKISPAMTEGRFFCACGAILFSADSFFGIKNFRSCGAEIRHLRLRRKSILFLKRAPQAGLR